MLKLKKEVYEQLISHAQDGFPLEVCGYLGEKNGIVSCIKKMKNTDESNEHFAFDPAEQFIAVKEMRKGGYKASVVYHSHPETPARPSEEDIRLANDPELSYIIVSLADIDPVVKSFKIENSTVYLEKIMLM